MSARRIERRSSIEWVRVDDIHVAPNGQRELRPYWVSTIAANLDPDQLGFPVLSRRDGQLWVMDGQHRVAALKECGYGDQLIECEVWDGLTQKEEAEKFLVLNRKLSIRPLDSFIIGVDAQRARECEVARTVQAQGLRVGKGKTDISAVGALMMVYDLSGPARLGLTLRIIRDAYGDAGMRGEIIGGIGLLAHRYDGLIDETRAVEKLSSLRGGMNGLVTKAALLKKQTARPMTHCIAAAAVEVINAGRGGAKLPGWWE